MTEELLNVQNLKLASLDFAMQITRPNETKLSVSSILADAKNIFTWLSTDF